MSYFNILRNRHNEFVGFNVDGFRIKCWEELQKLAESRIAKHDPSWLEIQIDGDDLQSESQAIVEAEIQGLRALVKRQRAELEDTNFKLIQSLKTQDNLIRFFETYKAATSDSLRAIKMIVSTSIRNGDIALNHWVRDERLKHLSDVIQAQAVELGCFEMRSYDDDF